MILIHRYFVPAMVFLNFFFPPLIAYYMGESWHTAWYGNLWRYILGLHSELFRTQAVNTFLLLLSSSFSGLVSELRRASLGGKAVRQVRFRVSDALNGCTHNHLRFSFKEHLTH
jgi:hypothetical protein